MNKKISVVVSVYNEQQSLDSFYQTACGVLENCSWDYELIFVNDGSSDKSEELLRKFAQANSRVRVISFARNFGHEAAMIAGIDHAVGNGIICMDADLQHPPECIPDIIEKFEQGYQVITMVRTENADTGFFRKTAAKLFYKTLNLLSDVKFSENASDFFALSDKAAAVLREDYRERVRYLRGYVQSLGFEKTTLEFRAAKRFAGESKYNLMKLIRFSLDTMCSFSLSPLKAGIFLAFITGAVGVILGIAAIVCAIEGVTALFTSITAVVCILFALLFAVLGVIGQYLGIILREIKDRPIYIVRDIIN